MELPSRNREGGSGLRRVVQPGHRSALEHKTVRVVEEIVEDGVTDGGSPRTVVPVLDRDLAGEQRAAAGIAFVEDFQEIVSSLARERKRALSRQG